MITAYTAPGLNGMEARVTHLPDDGGPTATGGYAVTLHDTDACLTLPTVRTFPDLEWATTYADALVLLDWEFHSTPYVWNRLIPRLEEEMGIDDSAVLARRREATTERLI